MHTRRPQVDINSVKKKHQVYIDEAIQLARKSPMIKKHGCVIVRKNEIIGRGFNYRTDTLKQQYSIHAEVDAIYNAKKIQSNLEDCTLFVVRISNDKLAKSIPCENCQKCILEHRIGKIYFST